MVPVSAISACSVASTVPAISADSSGSVISVSSSSSVASFGSSGSVAPISCSISVISADSFDSVAPTVCSVSVVSAASAVTGIACAVMNIVDTSSNDRILRSIFDVFPFINDPPFLLPLVLVFFFLLSGQNHGTPFFGAYRYAHALNAPYSLQCFL